MKDRDVARSIEYMTCDLFSVGVLQLIQATDRVASCTIPIDSDNYLDLITIGKKYIEERF